LPGGALKRGQKVDVYDAHPEVQRYLEAKVVDEDAARVKVHYKEYSAAFDEWLPRDSERIAPHGWHTRTRTVYKPSNTKYWATHERKAQISTGDSRAAQYIRALTARSLALYPMGGDGNCLFRSVAHQVYGDQELHAVTRRAAVEYMAVEQGFFRPFIAGEHDDFEAYIGRMAVSGEWGDDPEIQALSELYDRSVEIWAWDEAAGARKLRVFSSARADARPPIRLSYYGGGHYDSVVGPDWQPNLLRSPPGELEARTIERQARARALGAGSGGSVHAALAASEAEAAEAATLRAALDASRGEFEATASVDIALLLSMGIDPALAVQAATEGAAGVGGAGAAGVGGLNAAQLETQLLQQAVAASEAEAADQATMAAVLASSAEAAGTPEDDIQRALAMSLGAAGAGGCGMSADDEIAAAIALSLSDADGGGMGVHGGAAVGASASSAAGGFGGVSSGSTYGQLLDLQAQMTEDEQIEALMTGRLPQRLGGHALPGVSEPEVSSGSGGGSQAAAASVRQPAAGSGGSGRAESGVAAGFSGTSASAASLLPRPSAAAVTSAAAPASLHTVGSVSAVSVVGPLTGASSMGGGLDAGDEGLDADAELAAAIAMSLQQEGGPGGPGLGHQQQPPDQQEHRMQ
jgi:hypothetical protein